MLFKIHSNKTFNDISESLFISKKNWVGDSIYISFIILGLGRGELSKAQETWNWRQLLLGLEGYVIPKYASMAH